jgi:hypothetical protein
MSGGRYPVLRSFAIMHVFVAAVAILACVIGIAYVMARAPFAMGDRIIISLGIAVAACFTVLAMLAIAELIKLFIDIEHNTRGAAVGTPTRDEVPMGSDSRMNRLHALDEETAEAALLRGH